MNATEANLRWHIALSYRTFKKRTGKIKFSIEFRKLNQNNFLQGFIKLVNQQTSSINQINVVESLSLRRMQNNEVDMIAILIDDLNS